MKRTILFLLFAVFALGASSVKVGVGTGKTKTGAGSGKTKVEATAAPAPGWWVVSGKTCVAAYQAVGAASLAASYVNLANPGVNDAAPGTAPTWNSTDGWVFNNASSQYLTTGVVPGSGWTMIVRFTGADTSNRLLWLCGVDGGNYTRFYLSSNFITSGHIYGGGDFLVTGSVLTSGVMAVADNQGYLNGSADGSAFTAWSGTQSDSIYIGCLNTGSATPNYFFAGNIQACAVYSGTLSSGEISAQTTKMNALP